MRWHMPVYEYRCEKCAKKFHVTCSMSEHDTKKARCPECKAAKVTQVFSSFFTKTDSKS